MKPAAIVLLLLPACAQAQVYKCIAADSSTSYATVPCPAGSGETTRIIEPVPPSGVLNIPQPEQPAEEQPAGDNGQSASPVSGLTVIPDSEDPARQQKRTLLDEEAAQRKRDEYENTLHYREQQPRNRQVKP